MARGALDWDPVAYARLRELRVRPGLDLLRLLGAPPEGAVVDLFCGEGAMVPALRARFPGRRLIGVDSSVRKMEAAWGYDEIWRYGDFRWSQERSNALIFCGNGIPDTERHNSLLPELLELLAPGGLLAVQIPRQFAAPSHRLIREIAFRLDPRRFPNDRSDPVAPPAAYRRLLAPLAQVEVWETEYLHPLTPVAEGHPVRAITQFHELQYFFPWMSDGERRQFLLSYDAALSIAYPAETEGTILYPYRCLFLVAVRCDCADLRGGDRGG